MGYFAPTDISGLAKLSDLPATGVLSGVYTIDTLPDPAANLDKYAIVSDLFGSKRDKVLASQSGSLAYWQPVRPVYGATLAVSGADLTLLPMKHASVLAITASVGAGVSRNVTLSTALGFPGCMFEMTISGAIGALGSLNIAGTGLGSAVSVLLGSTKRFFLDYSSGSLAWRQLT